MSEEQQAATVAYLIGLVCGAFAVASVFGVIEYLVGHPL